MEAERPPAMRTLKQLLILMT